jgi:hypothetical protein
VLGFALRTRLGERVIQLPQLIAASMQLDEHRHLAAENLRDDGYRNVVDGADLVAAQLIELGDVDGGDEDDRRALEPRMLAHHPRHLEPVHPRHVDVEQDDGEVVFQRRPSASVPENAHTHSTPRPDRIDS